MLTNRKYPTYRTRDIEQISPVIIIVFHVLYTNCILASLLLLLFAILSSEAVYFMSLIIQQAYDIREVGVISYYDR